MELNPWAFVFLTYGIAAVIAVFVAVIVKVISYSVQRKKAGAADTPEEAPEAEDKGGDAA